MTPWASQTIWVLFSPEWVLWEHLLKWLSFQCALSLRIGVWSLGQALERNLFFEGNWRWQWGRSWKENILDFCICYLFCCEFDFSGCWVEESLSTVVNWVEETDDLFWTLNRGCLRTGPWRLFFGTHTCCLHASIRICLLIFGFVPDASYLVCLDSVL